MSRYVAALVYRKKIGSMARKSVLAYCAERANDDGTGVWASKLTMSKEIECSKQTIIDTIKGFVADGIMIEAGRRKCSNGYVVEYDLNIAAIDALPDAISRDESTGPILDRSNSLTPRGQAAGPQEVKPVDPNRPKTVLKPSVPQTPKGDLDLFSENGSTSTSSETSEGLSSNNEKEKQTKEKADSDFDAFWKAYPKKAGKPSARKAWDKAIKKDPPEIITAAAVRYAKWLQEPVGPGDFRPAAKNPQGWLNDERWRDPDIATVGNKQSRAQRLIAGL